MAAKTIIIAGPARSGKTVRSLDRYRHFLRDRWALRARWGKAPSAGRTLWIGPNRQAVAQVRDRLLESSGEAFLDPQILTFARFAEATVADSVRRIRPISRLQKRRILQRVAGDSLEAGKLKHFSWVAKTPGFLAQAGELIAELKRQDIWPDDFLKRARQPRDRDLAAIYDLYQQVLNDHDLYDAEGRFWEARRLLSRSSGGAPPEFSLIVVDGFSDFTSAQYDILEQLGNRAAEMLVTLTLESSSQHADRSLLFAKTKNTFERLRQKLPESQVEFVGSARFVDPALAHLECNLFRDPNDFSSAEPTTTGVEILAANGVHGEIEEIARRVKGLLHDGQIRPAEVVVVFRNLGEVAGRIREVFSGHGIPHALGPWESLACAPLFRGIFSLLRLHAEDWPFGQLLTVVGNRLFRRFDDARIAMERCLRAAQLPSGRRALVDQIRRWASADGETASEGAEDEKLLQARLALGKLEELAGLLEKLPSQAPLASWIEHGERLLEGLDVFLGQNGRHQAAWTLLREGLQSLESVDTWTASEASQLSIDEFMELLEMVGRDLQLPAERDAVGRVRILDAEAARYVSAKHVFLAGLKESSFSSSEPVDSLYDFDGAPPTQSRAGDEMLLFYELATRATEKLTLSYPALDAKGQSLSPSPLLTELEQCFGETPLPRTSMPLGEIAATHKPWSKSDYRRQAVAQALEGDRAWLAGLVAEPESAPLGKSLLRSISCVARRGERGVFGPFDGLLESDRAKAVLAKRFDASHLWSPSQLEGYAKCPFRFFAEQILSLEPCGELTLRSDARRRGSLLHQVLATLHQHRNQEETAGEDSSQLTSSQLIKRFHTVLGEAVDSMPLAGLQRWLREIERREIEAWAEQYADQEIKYRGQWGHLDEPLRPALFEVRFGPQVRSGSSASDDSASTALPFELDLGSEQILLTGQIDRVDVGRVGQTTVFNIIDYKSGTEVKLQDKNIRSGRQLQLPLYALAAERLLLADQDALALSTGYWSIKGQGFASGGKSGALEIRELKDQAIQTSEQWDQLQPLLLERIGQLIGGIRGGQFPVINEDENCTRWCSFSTICRVAHARSLEKAWDVNDEAQMTDNSN